MNRERHLRIRQTRTNRERHLIIRQIRMNREQGMDRTGQIRKTHQLLRILEVKLRMPDQKIRIREELIRRRRSHKDGQFRQGTVCPR